MIVDMLCQFLPSFEPHCCASTPLADEGAIAFLARILVIQAFSGTLLLIQAKTHSRQFGGLDMSSLDVMPELISIIQEGITSVPLA